MCNRYSLSKKHERIIEREFGSVEFYFMERFNIAPTQMAQIILLREGKLECVPMKWGWTTRARMLANARSETAQENLFKDALAQRRCLVPSDGFYEWRSGKPPQPYRIVMASRAIFWMAGLWQKDEFVILTCPARGYVRSLHDRMPVIVPETQIGNWLRGGDSRAALENGVYEPLEGYPVTTQMNNARFESPECIAPIEIGQKELF